MIFRRIKPTDSDEDIAQKQWDKIEENLESTNFSMPKFIRYQWLSKYEFLTESKLYDAIKQKLDKEKSLSWQEYLTDLVDDSQRLKELIHPEEDYFKGKGSTRRITNSLKAISSMGVSQCYVLLLAISRNFDMKKKWEREVEFLENFCFNYHAVGKLQAVRVEKKYSEYARRIENLVTISNDKDKAGKLEEELKVMIGELSKLKTDFVTSEHFKNQFIANIKYSDNSSKRHLLHYTLLKINEYLSGGTGELKVDSSVTNIEHIMPRKPIQWGYNEEEVADYINDIGNLTLLHQRLNSQAGNKKFLEKLQHLEGSDLTITKDVLNFINNEGIDDWDEEIINKRSQYLAEIAFSSIWNI